MIIICGQCQTKFRINAGLIKVTGTRVRCSNCQAVFIVFAPALGDYVNWEPPAAPPPSEQAGDMDDIERELESFFQSDTMSELEDLPSQPPPGHYRLMAIPQRRAENNPINLIMENGDNFVVPETAMLMRPPALELPGREPAGSSLGLEADPLAPAGQLQNTCDQGYHPSPDPQADGRQRTDSDNQFDSTIQPRPQPLRTQPRGFTPRQRVLLLALSVVAALLVISTLFLQFSPWSASLSTPNGGPPAAPPQLQPQAGDPLDNQILTAPENDGLIRVAFLSERSSHHYVQNTEAGTLLVLIGEVQNNDDKPISYIRLKGILNDRQENVIAERQVFAGNVLTEDELKTLPVQQILRILSLRSGQSGSNVNVPPGQSIPYMVVFDRLPPDPGMYLLEPIGYSDTATESIPTAQP